MKIAIVVDWLVTYAGAERVLEQLLEIYPDADVFAVCDFVPTDARSFLKNKKITTTFIQKLPFAAKNYQRYLALMPLAIEQLDVTGYDVVLSSSHAVAKGVITGPHQIHISYVHSPMRYAWDLQHQYLQRSGLNKGLKGFCAQWILHKMRIWDLRTVNSVDHFVSNSNFIGQRMWKVYRRPATTIYPPVDTNYFDIVMEKSDYYVTASRIVPYKRVDIIVDAFRQMPDKKLIVIGDGSELKKIQMQATPNITFLGYQSRDTLKTYLQQAKGFIFAAEEDFGISPVEAQACGTPVLAFGKGGVLETVIAHKTGLFFKEQSADALRDAVMQFEQTTFNPQDCRDNAERFSEQMFKTVMSNFITQQYEDFYGDR